MTIMKKEKEEIVLPVSAHTQALVDCWREAFDAFRQENKCEVDCSFPGAFIAKMTPDGGLRLEAVKLPAGIVMSSAPARRMQTQPQPQAQPQPQPQVDTEPVNSAGPVQETGTTEQRPSGRKRLLVTDSGLKVV